MYYLEITPKDGEPKRIPLPDFMPFPEMQGMVRGRIMQGAEKAAVVYDKDGEADEIWAWTRSEWEQEQARHALQLKMLAWEAERLKAKHEQHARRWASRTTKEDTP